MKLKICKHCNGGFKKWEASSSWHIATSKSKDYCSEKCYTSSEDWRCLACGLNKHACGGYFGPDKDIMKEEAFLREQTEAFGRYLVYLKEGKSDSKP